MAKLIDLTGQRFGRLTVVERTGTSKNGNALWACRCDCGNVAVVRGASLKNGITRSCGCLIAESTKDRNTTHGLRKTRLYHVWANMKDRCLNPNTPSYSYYGGRGITICDEWRDDFQAFYDWAMANGHRDDLSIDRIDNDKGYNPDNCRWATHSEQMHNRRHWAK